MYGVETEKLEPADDATTCSTTTGDQFSQLHRATRAEILQYYDRVRQNLEEKYNFTFVGSSSFDFTQLSGQQPASASGRGADEEGGVLYHVTDETHNQVRSIRVLQKLVDARYLEPDLPVAVPPKFSYDPESIRCIPVNALVDDDDDNNTNNADKQQQKYYVVIGSGKTGMDAIVYLLQHQNVPPEHIWWIAPHEAWITARENIGSCLEFLHTCTQIAKQKQQSSNSSDGSSLKEILQSKDLVQEAFLQWEKEGRVYRMDPNSGNLPTKFKDATLSQNELALLQTVQNVLRNRGRVQAIQSDTGALQMEDGTVVDLPWKSGDKGNSTAVKDQTTYVHCSAGAFNYTKQLDCTPPPVFEKNVITIQDVYGTPGFCFVGSVIGKLESLGQVICTTEKNSMCKCPNPDPAQAKLPLGPSGGDIEGLSSNHGFVQRLSNLKKWMGVPGMREWLVGHRLFNLGHLRDADEISAMANDMWNVLQEGGLVN